MEEKAQEFDPDDREAVLKDLHEKVMLSDQDDEKNW